MSERPRLEEVGDFGLTRTIRFAEERLALGLKRRVRGRLDDARGALSWRLMFKVLPKSLDGGILMDGGEILSRADYLFAFFCARKREERESFVIRCPTEDKNYLVAFIDSELTYEMFSARLFSSGVQIEQVDEADINTLEDGSLGASDNPDQI